PAATGRRLFYDAVDPVVSGGLGCAGCHPDGRDDGFVWRETPFCEAGRSPICGGLPFFVAHEAQLSAGFMEPVHVRGRARQTPMLAGRVDAQGPYGWRADGPTLAARIRTGFSLHRWQASPGDGFGRPAEDARA